MSQPVSILILDDDPDSRHSLLQWAKELWIDAEIIECPTAGYAVSEIEEREMLDLAIIDLNMKLDTSKSLPDDFLISGGFLAYFAINRKTWKGLTPLVVIFTADGGLQKTLRPFVDEKPLELVRGRPFSIVDKKLDRIDNTVLKALIDLEYGRYQKQIDLFFNLEDLAGRIIALRDDELRLKSDWEAIGRTIVGVNGLIFRKAFPAFWYKIYKDWTFLSVNDSLTTFVKYLNERDYLRTINEIFDDPEAAGQVIMHYLHDYEAMVKWEKFAEEAKRLPAKTRKSLLVDLGGDSWTSPPWAGASYESTHNSWVDKYGQRFKTKWREWSGETDREDFPTIIRCVLDQVNSSFGTVQWLSCYLSGLDRARTCYIDPHFLATEVDRAVGEIRQRVTDEDALDHVHYLRVIQEREPDGKIVIALDLVGMQSRGFAKLLSERAEDLSFSYKEMANRLRGWCDVWIFTHEEISKTNVIGINISNPEKSAERDWPHRHFGGIDWDKVGCIIRWRFRIPSLNVKHL